MPQSHSPSDQHPLQTVAFVSAYALILLATIFRGGNRYVPLSILDWLGILVFGALVLQVILGKTSHARERLGSGYRKWALLALTTLPIWIAAVQLVPLPNSSGWLALSQAPTATWASALAGLPIAALFFCATVSDSRSLKLFVRLWLWVAVFQGLLGILQLGSFEVLNFGGDKTVGVVGTFANRNHFASFLSMTIPLVVLGVKNLKTSSEIKGIISWPMIAVLFVLIAALFASLSRAGLVVGLVAAAVSSWLLWRPARQWHRINFPWLWALVPFLAILALAMGGLDWLSRFDATQLELSAKIREVNRLASWEAAKSFWPMGSGLGTFRYVFPQVQPPEISHLVDYAHNEYAQWFLELGVLFPMIAVAMLSLVGARLTELVKNFDRPSQEIRLALASLTGLVAVSLHAWVDFPLRIPANAMLAAFLLGVFLRTPEPETCTQDNTSRNRQRVDRTHG